MAGLQGNSVLLGGVVVEISAPLTGLRRDLQGAKTLTSAAERALTVRVPVLLDVRSVAAQARALSAALQRMIPPVRVPVVLVPSGGGGGGAFGGGGGQAMLSGFGGSRMPMQSVNVPPPMRMLPGGGSPMLPGPGGGLSAITGSGGGSGVINIPGVPSGSYGTWRSGVGMSAMRGQGESGGIGLGTALRIGAYAGAINRVANTVVDFAPGFQDRNDRNFVTRTAGRATMADTLGSFPLLGGMFRALEGAQGRTAALEADKAAAGVMAGAPAQLDAIQAARSGLRSDSDFVGFRDTGDVAAGKNAAFARGQIVLDMAEQRRDAMKVAGAMQHAGYDNYDATAQLRQVKGLQAARIAEVDRQEADAKAQAGYHRDISLRGVSSESQSAGLSLQASQSRQSGDFRAASMQERYADRLGFREGLERNLDNVFDPGLRKQIQGANEQKMAAYSARQSEDVDTENRARSADKASAGASVREAWLRNQKKYYAADVKAFDDATKAKLDSIKDLDAKQNESTRRAAERSVMVAQHEKQLAENIAGSQAGATAAGLRTTQHGFAASMVEFEASAKRRLDNIEDPRERSAAKAEIDAQRREMLVGRGRQLEDVRGGLSARTAAAGASGQFNDRLAGTYGTLAGMASELRNADADVRGQVASTQRAELSAMRDRMLRGSEDQRALEFDPRRMVGSTGADRAEHEQTEILKLILLEIKNRSGVPLAG